MKSAWGMGGIVATLLMAVVPAHAVQIDLFEYALKIDRVLYEPNKSPLPATVDLTGFDTGTGLGVIRVSAMGNDSGEVPYVGLFVDHEIHDPPPDPATDPPTTGFFNESGRTGRTSAPSLSWEIDEPGHFFGDIVTNLRLSMLDSKVFGGEPDKKDDVSMALAWSLTASSRFALKDLLFDFIISQTAPTTGFYLAQHDAEVGGNLFFSSRFSVIPEPATLALFALGLAGMGFAGGRRYGKGSGGG